MANDLVFRIGADLTPYRSAMSRLPGETSRTAGVLTRSFGSVTTSVQSITRGIFNLRNAILGLGVGLIARSFFQTAIAMQNAEVQLRAITGSAGEAKAILADIRAFAVELPITTQEIVEAFVLLRSVGVPNARAVVETLAGVSIAMQKDIRNVASAVISLETEVLRRLGVQLERTGRTATITTGKVRIQTENDMQSIRNALLEAFQKTFPDAIKLSQDSWTTAWNTMKSEWNEFQDAVVQAGIIQTLTEALKLLNQQLKELRESGRLKEIARDIGDFFLRVFEGVAVVTTQVGRVLIPLFQLIGTSVGMIFDIIAANPLVAQFGLVGLLLFGPQGALMLGAAGLLIERAIDLARTGTTGTGMEEAFLGPEETTQGIVQREKSRFEQIVEALLPTAQEKGDELSAALFGLDIEQVRKRNEQAREAFQSLLEAFGEIGQEEPGIREFFERIREKVEEAFGTKGALGKAPEQIQAMSKELEKLKDQLEKEIDALTVQKKSLDGTTESQIRATLTLKDYAKDTQKSKDEVLALARAVDLEKEALKEAQLEFKRQIGLPGAFMEGLAEASLAMGDTFDRIKQMGLQTAQALQRGFSDVFFDVFTNQAQGMQEVFLNLVNSMLRIVSDFLSQQAVQLFLGLGQQQGGRTSLGGGILGAIVGGISSIFSPAASFGGSFGTSFSGSFQPGGIGGFGTGFAGSFQEGGFMRKGEFGVVGERGPEIFAPSVSGRILPSISEPTEVNVTQVFNLQPGLRETVRAEILTMMPLFRQQAVEAVIAARDQGGRVAKKLGARKA